MRRVALITFVVFQFVWFNVVLPGHTRGVVTVPGYSCGEPGKPSCCHKENEQPGKDKGRAAHCAICFFAARVVAPDVIDFRLRDMGLAGVCEEVEMVGAGVEGRFTCWGRGPPTA